MANLRKLARGRPCQVRVVLCSPPDTTVLAHVRLSGISGMGLKAPDQLGAHCCANCHSYCDTHHDDATKVAFYKGVFRTQAQLIKEGLL